MGHCRRFAPHYKEFGKMVANWKSVVQVLALNCVEKQNEEVCRNYSVVAYPTVRLFWINVNTQEEMGETIENVPRSADFLRNATIEFILKNLKTKQAPTNWPNLNKIKLADQGELKKLLNSDQLRLDNFSKPVIAIAEKNNSLVGQQVCAIFF